MQVPVEDYLETRIKNPALRDIVAQHFFRNTPTFFALSYFHFISTTSTPREVSENWLKLFVIKFLN
jgi:hypothetical protein